MSESYRKLIQFSIFFLIAAIAVFFYMNGKDNTVMPHGSNMAMEDDGSDKMQEELASFKAALDEDPENLQTIIKIANLNYDLNQSDSAIVYYEKALEIEPDQADILTDCAVMHFREGNSEKALEYLEKAINLEPNLGQAWFNKGFILMAGMNEPVEAIAAWRKFIEIEPESKQAKFIKSQIEAIEANENN